MPEDIVLSFDIGIRNLAWCLASKNNDNYTIHGWQNYDLLMGRGNDSANDKCASCSAKATYVSNEKNSCVRHCPGDKPALRDLSGNLLKKLPTLAVLREILSGKRETAANKTVAEEKLAKYFSLPIQKKKQKSAIHTELTVLHDAIRKFIQDNLATFKKATHILLENQPVLKNPTMKSVQILLFATLRDFLQPNPPQLLLVHAAKKVKGTEKGDAGYKDRKAGSEARVQELLKKTENSSHWSTFFSSHTKKNDLADAFCMCADKLV